MSKPDLPTVREVREASSKSSDATSAPRLSALPLLIRGSAMMAIIELGIMLTIPLVVRGLPTLLVGE